VLGAGSLTATFAQTPPSPPPAPSPVAPPPPAALPPPTALTSDEKAQFQKAHDQVLATNPSLKAQAEDMVKKRALLKSQQDTLSSADKKAIYAEGHDLQHKMKAAMLALDPSLAPIFDKLAAITKAKHAAAAASAPGPNAPTGPIGSN